MTIGNLILPALAAVVAGAIAAVSGFGIGSLLTPVLLVWFAPREAVALVAIPHAVASTFRWLKLRADVDRITFRQFGVASAVGGLAGAGLQARLGAGVLTGVLGILLVMAGTGELTGRRLPLPRTRLWRLIGGGASGFFGGLVGNQGGLRSAALLGFQLTPRQLVATATAAAVIVDLVRVPVYVATSGAALAAHPELLLVTSGAVVIGTFIGVPVLGKLPERAYRRIIGSLLVMLGLALLVSAV